MAGYDDTYQMIISTLMGRPVGTEIQPDNQQAYEINMLNYIRSLELIANGPLIGIAEANTQPIQPNDARACYIAGVAQDRTVTFQNFRNYLGQPIQITNGQMEACLVILIWDTQYWSATQVPTNIISAAEQANFYYSYNIRKTYASISAMNADSTNPIGTDGKYINVGDLVSVVNTNNPDENGFYSRIPNGWQLQSGFNFQLSGDLGQSNSVGITQNRITNEFLREISLMNGVYNRFVTLANSTLVYRDRPSETKGYYLNWNNGELTVNPSFAATRFFPIESSTQYIFNASVHSYLWYDENLNFLSGDLRSNDGNPTSPANAVYVRVNFAGDQNIGMYKGTTIPTGVATRGYTQDLRLSQTVLKPVIYDNTDDFPITQYWIDNGVSDVILAAVCDVEYEEGYDYSFATGNSQTKDGVRLYKHQKGVIPATSESISSVDRFIPIETIGKLTVLGSTSTRSRMIVDWSKLKGITSWNNLYAYHGLGVNPAIFRGAPLFKLYDKLQTNIDVVAADVSRLDTSLHTVVIDEERVLEPTYIGEAANSYSATTSTFSGWGQPVGILASGGNAFGFKVKARATPITQIRFTIYDTDPNGAILLDVTKDVNIPATQEANIVIKMPLGTFDNSAGKQCFAMWRCNALCDLWSAKLPWIYPVPTYPGSYYSTQGSLTQATLVSGSGSGYNYPLTYGTYEKVFELINQADVDHLVKVNAQMVQVSTNIKNPSIFGSENGSWTLASSTFSGWGELFGTPTGFNAVAVNIRARAANTEPITEVRVRIREGLAGRNGAILYTGSVTGLNINAGEFQRVVVKLNDIVDNPNGDLLWIEYMADKLLDQYAFSGYPYTPADDVTYPKCAYSTSGNFPSVLDAGTSTSGYPFTVWYGMYEEFFELTDEQIANIAERLDMPDPSEETVDVNLPDVITAVVGDTLQLFFRGMVYAVDPYIYDLLVACTKGNKYPRYFQFTPAAGDVGDVTFKLSVKNNNGKLLGTAQSTLKIRAAVKSPDTNVNICCFGDSLTSAGTWCAEGDRRLTGSGGTPAGLGLSNITFCGSKKNGTTGYFGVGGWQWTDYTTRGRAAFRLQVSGVTTVSVGAVYSNNGYQYTVAEVNVTSGSGNILMNAASFAQTPQLAGTLTKVSGTGDATITFSSWEENSQNPLWNKDTNQMDFVPYANAYCNGQIDAVYTLLSWNGQSPWKTDFSGVIANVKIFADTLHRDFPNAKLKIMGIQVPSVNGGMGANYGATGTGYADGYGNVITALNQNKAYQDFANQAAYKDFVEFVNVSTQVDSEYNMPFSMYPVNTRNSTNTEMRGTNGVHPSTDGYYQIGDVLFRNVIKEFCQ